MKNLAMVFTLIFCSLMLFLSVSLNISDDSASISQSPSLNDECLVGRSHDGTSKLTVSFVNNFSGPVEVVWLNYEGQQVSYGIIEPNQTKKQETMISHPWAFISPTTGNCIGYYNPKVGDDNKKINTKGYTSSGYGVSDAPTSSVKEECSASNVEGCTVEELCKNSTVPNGNTRVWKTFVSVYKSEAKKRGLTCGVK